MKTKLYLFLFAGLLFSCLCHAQTTGTTSAPTFDIMPKTPEAAAIAKYGSVPVALSTGIPEISIPIYTINLKGVKVPISLSYNSAGIKVDEQATKVGLGWSLQAGGAVTQAIFGQPDFWTGGWLYSNLKTPQNGPYPTDFNGNSTELTPNFLTDSTYQFYKEVLTGKSDAQPDIFTASFLGRSIKFYFDQQFNVHLMPYRRVRIDTLQRLPNTVSFKITDENDVVYIFNTEDRATTTSDSPQAYYDHGSVHVVDNKTIFLTKIITPSGDSVRFNYAYELPSFTNQLAESRFQVLNNCLQNKPDDRSFHSTTACHSAVLTSIISSKGDSVVFTYHTAERLDLAAAHSLANISIYKKNNPAFNKSFNFKYGYFYDGGPTVPAGAVASIDSQDDFRLRLDSVIEAGKGPYAFTYNNQIMPKRLSMSQDHWGYYNGRTNSTLMPIDSAWGFYTGANREPDPVNCQVGLLTAIKYPTGGKTAFTYEPNTLNYRKIFPIPVPLQATQSASNTAVQTENFTVPSGTYDMSVSYVTPSEPIEGLEPHGQFKTIQILKNGALVRQFSGSNPTGEPISLAAGNYSFKLSIDSNNVGAYISLYYRLTGTAPADTILGNYQTGGLRVKSIDDYTADNILANNTRYDYSTDADSTKSSNVIDITPLYHFVTHSYAYDYESNSFPSCYYNSQGSQSVLQYNGQSWANAYYRNVKVYHTGKSAIGYTSYLFMQPGGDGIAGWPFSPQIEYDWFNNNILEQKDFKYNSGSHTYSIVKRTNNSYKTSAFINGPGNPPHESFVRGLKIGVVTPVLAGTQIPTRFLLPEYFISTYQLRTTWFYQTGTTETIYDPADSTRKSTTISKFFYENPDHIEMTRQEISKSTGEQLSIVMRYPKDYNTTYPYNSSPVVEKRIMLKGGSGSKLTSAGLTLYKNQPGSFPYAYYQLKVGVPADSAATPAYSGSTINANYEKRDSYYYDSEQNIVTLRKDSLQVSGYQWGYNKEYPVAECRNAQNDEFFYQGFEETTGSNVLTSNAHTGNKYFNAGSGGYTTSDKLTPGYHGKSYLISYWSKDGSGKWIYSGELAYTGQALSGQIDDVRIIPSEAALTTYTYDPAVGMTSATDTHGQVTYFEYDNYQRLVNIRDKDHKIIKHTDYHYQNQ